MLDQYLLENYGYNEPIFLNELTVPGMSDNALRQAVKRLTSSHFLIRFDTGIYYIPRPSSLLGTSNLDPYMVILRKYVQNDSGTYGYISGAAFANQIGLTSQMPAIVDIVTNKEATKGRVVTIGGQSVRVKCPVVPVTDENARILQFLDMVAQADKYSEFSEDQMEEKLRVYLKECHFEKKQLSDVMDAVTGRMAKKLIEWDMIYEFAS